MPTLSRLYSLVDSARLARKEAQEIARIIFPGPLSPPASQEDLQAATAIVSWSIEQWRVLQAGEREGATVKSTSAPPTGDSPNTRSSSRSGGTSCTGTSKDLGEGASVVPPGDEADNICEVGSIAIVDETEEIDAARAD